MKLRLNCRDCRNHTTETILMLAAFLDAQDAAKMTLQSRRTIVSHLDACLRNNTNFLNHRDKFGAQFLICAVTSFAPFYQSQGRYEEAEQLYERALEGREKQLGWDGSRAGDCL